MNTAKHGFKRIVLSPFIGALIGGSIRFFGLFHQALSGGARRVRWFAPGTVSVRASASGLPVAEMKLTVIGRVWQKF